MEQASKTYKKHLTLQEGTALKMILELHHFRNKFIGFLQNEKFAIARLRVGDIKSDLNDILHDKGSHDLEHRIAFGTFALASFIFIWSYTCFYEINLQSLPMLIIFILTFFVSSIFLMVQLWANGGLYGELWTLAGAMRKMEEKITSLSSLPVELIKEKKFDEHIGLRARNFKIKQNEKLLELTKILKPEVNVLDQKNFQLHLWIEMQTPLMDYGEKLSNAFWPMAVNASRDLHFAINAILESMKSIELSADRHVEALGMITNREQVSVHFKNIQVIEEYAFRHLIEAVRELTCKITILYDLFMKNYEALNVKEKSHLENGYS